MAKLETTIRKFNERYKVLDNGCWKWQAFVAPDGYGKMMAFGEQYAHRVSYILHNGDIPKGMDVMHLCDSPSCVNPAHLEKGSHVDNMRDMVEKGRSTHSDNHKDAKLTSEAVIELRLGCLQVEDAVTIYNVAPVTARQAKYGTTWKHLNDTVAPY